MWGEQNADFAPKAVCGEYPSSSRVLVIEVDLYRSSVELNELSTFWGIWKD